MTDHAIELLVLDAHGVVFNNPFPEFLDELAITTGQRVDDVRERWHEGLRLPTWTGELSEEELWLCLAGSETAQNWQQRLESRYQPGPAAAELERWSSRVPLWLLSNHRSDWLLPRLTRLGLSRFFERVIVSDAIGAAKPDPAAYKPILEQVSNPKCALFVDDRSRNVRAAQRLGIRAVLASHESPWIRQVEIVLRSHPVLRQ